MLKAPRLLQVMRFESGDIDLGFQRMDGGGRDLSDDEDEVDSAYIYKPELPRPNPAAVMMEVSAHTVVLEVDYTSRYSPGAHLPGRERMRLWPVVSLGLVAKCQMHDLLRASPSVYC